MKSFNVGDVVYVATKTMQYKDGQYVSKYSYTKRTVLAVPNAAKRMNKYTLSGRYANMKRTAAELYTLEELVAIKLKEQLNGR